MEWFLLIVLAALIAWQVRLVLARVALIRSSNKQESQKQRQLREKLEQRQPGGSPERPLLVDSPAVIEPNIAGRTCLRCGAGLRMLEHNAVTVRGVRLREVSAKCRSCGQSRVFFFELQAKTQ